MRLMDRMTPLGKLDVAETTLRDQLAYDLFVKSYDRGMPPDLVEFTARHALESANKFVEARQKMSTET